jgi:hypothetical protein
MRIAVLSVMVAATHCIGGCATIAGDTSQSISLITTCEGSTAIVHAQCQLSNARGVRSITTPGTVEVPRAAGDLTITCESLGARGQATLSASGKWSTAGNLVMGGLVGVGVDLVSGASFEYPKEVTLQMACAR